VGTTGFTPRYASPEQWDKNYGTTGPASDIFALGLMLAEMCTLEPAFSGDSPGQILSQVLNAGHPVSIRGRRIDLPEAVEWVIGGATERQAHARFASAQEMLEALRAASSAPVVNAVPLAPPGTMPGLNAAAGAITGGAFPPTTYGGGYGGGGGRGGAGGG